MWEGDNTYIYRMGCGSNKDPVEEMKGGDTGSDLGIREEMVESKAEGKELTRISNLK